jgi:hypothetical protein
MANCRTKLIGVQVVYCEGEGDPKRAWVNLHQVHALAWCAEEVAAKGPGNPGNGRLPTVPNEPGKCKKPDRDAADENLCWWNGSQWICGVE